MMSLSKPSLTIFIITILLIIFNTTNASDLKLKVMQTPLGQPTTYIEFLYTIDTAIEKLKNKDTFVITFDSPKKLLQNNTNDDTVNPFDYVEPEWLHFRVTRNGKSTPIVEEPQEGSIFHPNDDNTSYSTEPIHFLFNDDLKIDDEIRFICTISYRSLLQPVISLPDQGGITVTLTYTPTTPEQPDDDEPPVPEIATQPLYIVASPQFEDGTVDNEIQFSYVDFITHENLAASYFSLRIPNNSLDISDVRFRPIGFWEYLSYEVPVYCYFDGIFVAHGDAPDTLGETYFFFTTPLEYKDTWVLPKGQDVVIDCLFVGSVVDKENYDKNEQFFGWAVSFGTLFTALSRNNTSIIVTPNTNSPKINDLSRIEQYLNELDEKEPQQDTININATLTRTTTQMFQFTSQWWRAQTSVNVPRSVNSHGTPSPNLLSTFSYLYTLSPRDGNLQQWFEDKHQSFYLSSENFPSDYKLKHASYSLACYRDAKGGGKTMDVFGYDTIHVLHNDNDNDGTTTKYVPFKSQTIQPFFNTTDQDGKLKQCDPNKVDGMFYVTIQIEHQTPFNIDTITSLPSPYPIMWLHLTEGLEHEGQEGVLVPYTRQNGNMVDAQPKSLVEHASNFIINAVPVTFDRDNDDQIVHNDDLDIQFNDISANVPLLNNVTFHDDDHHNKTLPTTYAITHFELTNITHNTTYLALFLPDGQYYFGTNKTADEANGNQLECFMNGDITDAVFVNGILNQTLEIVFNYDFIQGTTYNVTCPQDTSPLWLVPTEYHIEKHQNEQNDGIIKKDKKNILMVAHAIPNGYENGGVSAVTYINFSDDEGDVVPLWRKILYIAAVVTVLVGSLGGITILFYCCCMNRKEYDAQKDSDFQVDDGSTHQIHHYGSITD